MHNPLLVTKLYIPPFPSLSPGYQFWTVEYFISASSRAINSTLANVELIALDDAEIKYSTVQNWYPGDKDGKGGIYNFVTKRGLCKGKNSKISWTQVETGSAITWKYPSCILKGDNSVGEFYSIAITNNHQKAFWWLFVIAIE